jgi:hypothetical protein
MDDEGFVATDLDDDESDPEVLGASRLMTC